MPSGTRKKRKKGQVRSWGGASRSDPRSAADPLGVGQTGLSSARLSSYILPALAVRAIDPSQIGFLRCGGLSQRGAFEIPPTVGLDAPPPEADAAPLWALSFTAEKHPVSEMGAVDHVVEHVLTRVGGVFRHVDEAKQEARVARACAARGNSCTHSPAQ